MTSSCRGWIAAAAICLLTGACNVKGPGHETAFDAAKALLTPAERQLFDSDPQFRKEIGPRLVQNAECLKLRQKRCHR